MFNWFKKKQVTKRKQLPPVNLNRRAFDSAKFDNILSGWGGSYSSADDELRSALKTIRARVRSLCQNSEYARKFLAMNKSNVIGPHGIKFQAKTRREDGSLDSADNNLLERQWFEWGIRPEFVTVDARQDWVGVQHQVMETLARDGEVFIRLVKGEQGNPFGLSLWILEGDAISVDYNVSNRDSSVVMGIEQDQHGKPLAYYQQINPPSQFSGTANSTNAERVPADEMIHLFIQERPGQSRGIPWLNTALRPLQMLNQYQESELVASRIGSSAMGFFTSPDSAGYSGTNEDEEGNLITEFQPGQFQQLPTGMEFQSFDPAHPTTAYPDFVKSILRSVSSGALVSYNSLSGDLESVNYSSIRAGAKDEQAQWQSLQQMITSRFCNAVYQQWLVMSITTGALPLPISKLAKFKAVKWHPRGWGYVDPEKEMKAKKLAMEIGVTSLSEIAGEQGKEYTDILAQLAAEKSLIEEMGLKLGPPLTDEIPPETTDADGN